MPNTATNKPPPSSSSIFTVNRDGRFQLHEGVQVHMFMSQPPCGDACIFHSSSDSGQHIRQQTGAPSASPVLGRAGHQSAASTVRLHTGQCTTDGTSTTTETSPVMATRHNNKPAPAQEVGPTVDGVFTPASSNRVQLSSFHKTGAKPVQQASLRALPAGPDASTVAAAAAGPPEKQQSKQQAATWLCEDGEALQESAAGMLRRKPGRGAATLSMSCSDKLAKWCLLGIQVRVYYTYINTHESY